MNRRWQKEGRGRYETLPLPYGAFVASVPALPNSMQLCDVSDLYATFSALHAKGRAAELRTNAEHGFHYFMAAAAVSNTKQAPKPPAAEAAAMDVDTSIQKQPSLRQAEGLGQGPGSGKADGPTATGDQSEPVVPVSSKCKGMLMQHMQLLFQLGKGQVARSMNLAIVDDDGSVAMVRLFNGIQPPCESPEDEDAEAGAEAKEDSD